MHLKYNEVQLVELDLTTICNAKCPLCYRNKISFSEKYKKPFYRNGEKVLKQIFSFPNLKTVYLIGQLSEPTTHPEFHEIVNEIKKRGLKIKICTNGDLHEDEYWNRLGDLMDDNDEIWFTLCGSNQKNHEHYRVNTNLERILRHASCIRRIRNIDCAKCIRFSYNNDDIKSNKFKNMLVGFHKIEYLDTCYPSPQDDYKNNFEYLDFLPPKDIYDTYKKINSLVDFYRKMGKTDIYCQSIKDYSLQIDAFGDIYPCYVHMEENNLTGWDGNYDDILSGKCECCRYCNMRVVEYCNRNNRNSII